jgi:uncharacterized protein
MDLIIDVSDILKEVGASKEFEGSLTLEDMVFQGEKIGFLSPVSLSGQITNVGKLLVLDAYASVKLLLQCGACTKPFAKELKFDFNARLNKFKDPDDPDIFLYENEMVELEDMVIEFLLLELPMRKRCSEECKGLCPYCGRDLNIEKCQCEYMLNQQQEHKVDFPLEVLKSVLSANGEEV